MFRRKVFTGDPHPMALGPVALAASSTPLSDPVRISPWIGVAVRGRRLAAGLSMKQLAKRCGLSPMTIHFVETGRSVPKTDTLERLCAGLGISLMELMAEADRMSRA